jgi:hypothetical protein
MHQLFIRSRDENAFRHRDVHPQSRSFTRWNQWLRPTQKWCELRKIVFSWTHAKFPFRVRSGRKFKITELRIIAVTGKGFFDSNHAPADQSNRRTDLQGYAAWEIHPVMELQIVQ